MNPLSLFTPSFQLSFGAVAGIFMVIPNFSRGLNRQTDPESASDVRVCRRFSKIRIYFLLIVMTTIAATLPILPLILQTFHSLPIWTLPANLVTDFALTPALAFGLLGSAVGLLSPSLGSWILTVADLFSWFIIKVAHFFANLPLAVVRIPHLFLNEFLLCLLAATLLIWFVRNPKKNRLWIPGISALILILLICVIKVQHENRDLKAVFLNVGKGDAAFVSAPGSQGMLIDGGVMTPYFDAGKSIVIPFLNCEGIQSLECVLISHTQMDHMGGLLRVMKWFPAAAVMWNPVGKPPLHLQCIFNQVGSDRVFKADNDFEPFRLGRATVTILNSSWAGSKTASGKDLNNASLVARVHFGETSFLFTGDLELEGEEDLLARGLPLSASVLKVGHHGAVNSSSMRFLKAVRPRIAVISSEYSPSVNVPHQEVLHRLHSTGAEVFITGRDGAVTIETDGGRIYVSTGKGYGDEPRLVRKEFK
jgi:competence protein ComEC